jgi:hypothetical protein
VRLTARIRETVQMPRNLGLRGRHQREGAGKDAGEYNSRISPPSSGIRSARGYGQIDATPNGTPGQP